MTKVAELYEEGRNRVSELASKGPDDVGVPTCPDWTVHDVVAHVVGVCADVMAGNIEGVATDPWTAAQVEARRSHTIAELLAEWDDVGPPVAQMADQFGAAGHQLLFDLTSHEHDIRTALGRPGARDHESVADAIEFVVAGLIGTTIDERGLAPLELVTDLGTFVAGSGAQPRVRLEAPAFEVMRALSGRRSAPQMAAYDWGVDPQRYIPALVGGPFTLPPSDIAE